MTFKAFTTIPYLLGRPINHIILFAILLIQVPDFFYNKLNSSMIPFWENITNLGLLTGWDWMGSFENLLVELHRNCKKIAFYKVNLFHIFRITLIYTCASSIKIWNATNFLLSREFVSRNTSSIFRTPKLKGGPTFFLSLYFDLSNKID